MRLVIPFPGGAFWHAAGADIINCSTSLPKSYFLQINIFCHVNTVYHRLMILYQGTGPLRGPLSRPASLIGSVWHSGYRRIHRPSNNVTHNTTYAPKCVPRKGEREGEIRGLRNSERFPPRKFPPGNNSRISHAVTQQHIFIR